MKYKIIFFIALFIFSCKPKETGNKTMDEKPKLTVEDVQKVIFHNRSSEAVFSNREAESVCKVFIKYINKEGSTPDRKIKEAVTFSVELKLKNDTIKLKCFEANLIRVEADRKEYILSKEDTLKVRNFFKGIVFEENQIK